MASQVHEKTLNISNYQRTASQNYSSHQSEKPSLKSTNNKCWQGCRVKGTPLHCYWECKLVQPLWKTVWRFLRKLRPELQYDPAIPLLGIYPEKTTIQKDTCIPLVIVALFTVAKTWKQPKCPSTDEWIKKMWCTYTMEYCPAKKRMK